MNAPVTNPILAAALNYAARGMPVFPCSPATKRPLVPGETSPGAKDGGLYLASFNETKIREWWLRWPKALIGGRTGLTDTSGIFVIDLDPREHPADGMMSALSEWCGGALSEPDAQTGEIITPPMVRTQSGGLHLWYVYPRLSEGEKLGNRANLFSRVEDAPATIRQHVDVRGEGGYVILPPSVMETGNHYSWVYEWEHLPRAPARLIDLILRRGEFAPEVQPLPTPSPASAPAPSSGDAAEAAVRKYALSALERETREVAQCPKGGRNDRLNKAAFALGTLVGAGALSESMAQAGLEDAAARCGLVQADGMKSVRDTIRSGLTGGKMHPRDLSAIEREARERAERRGRRGPAACVPPDTTPSRKPETPVQNDDAPPPIAEDDVGEDVPSSFGQDGADLAIVEACAELDHSDTDNAERLIRHFGQDLAILAQDEVPGGNWLAWVGTHWDMAGGAARVRLVTQKLGGRIALEAEYLKHTPQEFAAIDKARAYFDADEKDLSNSEKRILKAGLAARIALEKRKKARRSHAVTSKNHARMEKALECAAPRLRRAPESYNPDSHKVATLTHTLTFVREIDLECPDPDVNRYKAVVKAEAAHHREDWITAVLPVAWQGEDAKAPRWRKFLEDMLPDAEKRRTVQQYSGAALLGDPLQFVMFHYGLGANGKSVFLETLIRVLGPGLAVGLPRESIVGSSERSAGGPSPDLVRLYGKRMVRILEVKADAPLQEDLLKKLYGGESFPVRTLFKGFFEFQNVAKAHMSGNGFPTIDGTDDGIWRRMLVVHWDRKIPEDQRRGFEEVVREFVREEGPGILVWLVEGVLDYLQNGIFIAPAVQKSTTDYRGEMDSIGEFFAACVREAKDARVQALAMYEAYVSWSMANAKRIRSQTKFGRTLAQRLQKSEIGGRLYYFDVELHDVPARPDSARNPDSG